MVVVVVWLSAYLLFKFNLHYLKNLKSKNFSCAKRRPKTRKGPLRTQLDTPTPMPTPPATVSVSVSSSQELQAPPLHAAVEQLFCLNIFIYLRPGNFCLFLASFYGRSLSLSLSIGPEMSFVVERFFYFFSLSLRSLLAQPQVV